MTTTPETRVVHDDVREMLIRTMGCAVSKLADGDLLSELADDFLVTANFVMSAPAAPAPEPVAYRWTPKTIRMWAYGAQVPHGADDSGFEIQPLYAAPPAPVAADYVLPCDVMIAPGTIIRKGCKLSTLLAGIKGRETAPEGTCLTLTRPAPVAASAVDEPEWQHCASYAFGSDAESAACSLRASGQKARVIITNGGAHVVQVQSGGASAPAGDPVVNAPRVRELEWGDTRITEDGRTAEDAKTPFGRYVATDTGWFLIGQTGYETERGLQAAKSAAQADYERRVLACLDPGQGWRTMDSAPRDGTNILATWKLDRRQKVGEVFWMDAWYADPSKPGWMPAGLDEEYGGYVDPTHWQPLPPPPAAEGK